MDLRTGRKPGQDRPETCNGPAGPRGEAEREARGADAALPGVGQQHDALVRAQRARTGQLEKLDRGAELAYPRRVHCARFQAAGAGGQITA
jgi:hypothetical protein